MGFGPLVRAALAAAALAGCTEGRSDVPPPPPTTGRSDALVAREAGAPAPVASTLAPKTTAASTGPRQLCSGSAPRPAPKGAVKSVSAPDAPALPGSIPFGVGKWVWVNLWAAWCGPCKEEIPRLLAWQGRLERDGARLELAFVSLDDDQRQLQRFLETQPAAGLRSSYWLPEGDLRTGWLAGLGVKDSPELPLHALVAPSGQVACVIQGAVEERDYPAVAGLVGAGKH